MEDKNATQNKKMDEQKSPYSSSLSELFCEYYKTVPRSIQKEFLTANGCFSKQSALDACLAKHDPHYAKVLAQYQLEDKTAAKFLEKAGPLTRNQDSPFVIMDSDDSSWKVASCPPAWEKIPLDKDIETNKDKDEKESELSDNVPTVRMGLEGIHGSGDPETSLLLEYLELCQRQHILLTLHLSRGAQIEGRVRRFDNEGLIFRSDLSQEVKKEDKQEAKAIDCYLSLTSILDLTPQEPFVMP